MLPSLPSKKLPQKRKKNGPKVMPSHPKLGPMGHSPASQLHHSCLGGVTLKASSLVLLESSICIKWVPSREPTYPTGGKRKIIFKSAFLGGYASSQEGNCWKRTQIEQKFTNNSWIPQFQTISKKSHLAQRILEFFFYSTEAICENTWCNSQISTFITFWIH